MHSYGRTAKAHPLLAEAFTPDGSTHPRWTSPVFWAEVKRQSEFDDPQRERRLSYQREKRRLEREARDAG